MIAELDAVGDGVEQAAAELAAVEVEALRAEVPGLAGGVPRRVVDLP